MTTSGQNSSSPSRTPTVAADIMRPALTAVEPNDHLAAASYLMKHAGETAMVVVGDKELERPVGVITEADIVQAVADGKDLNDVRVLAIMTGDPTVIRPATGIRDAASTMVSGRFRHLPVVDDDNRLLGIVDSLDVCGALLAFQPPFEEDAWTSR